MASTSGIRAGKAFVLIEALDKTGVVLNKIKNRIGSFASEISSMGRRMSLQAVGAMFPVGMAVKHGTEYDDIMRKVEARSEGTAEQMANLRKESMLLAQATGLLPTQLARVQDMLAQKGFNRGEISQMAKPLADLTRAGGDGKDLMMDAELSAKIVAGTINAFNMGAEDATMVSDMLTIALNKSNFSLEELVTSLQYAAPAASFYKVSLQETLAVLSAMRDLNIDASIAGTAFRNMMGYMAQGKEQDAFNEKLKELTGHTVEFMDATGNLHGPMALITALMTVTKGLGTAQRSDLITQLLETRATIPAAAVGSSQRSMAEMMAMLENYDGAAERTRKEMDAGLGGSFRRLAAQVSILAIRFEEALAPSLKSASTWLENVGNALSKLDAGIVTTVVAGIVVFGLFGTALLAVGQALYLLTPLLTGIGVISGGLSILLNPTVVTFGLLAAAIYLAIDAVDQLTGDTQIKQIGDSLEKAASSAALLGTALSESLQRVADRWQNTIKSITDSLRTGGIKEANMTLMAAIKLQWLELSDTILGLVDGIMHTWKEMSLSAPKLLASYYRGAIDRGRWEGPEATARREETLAKLERSIAEAEKTISGPIDKRREARQEAIRQAQEELKAAERHAGLEAAAQDWLRENEKQDTPITDFQKQLKEMQDKANALIGAGKIARNTIAPTANEALEAGSLEAARQFQENKFNAYNKVMDKVADNTREAADALAIIQVHTAGLRELAAV